MTASSRHPTTATFVHLVMGLLVLGCMGCKDATVSADLSGDIEGQVFDFETRESLPGVALTTSPPSSALVSDENGRFVIEDLPIGSYSITAARSGYESSSATVSVRENKSTQAMLFLRPSSEITVDTLSSASMWVGVTHWTTRVTAGGDSAFVRVDYRIRNTGGAPIGRYEAYFRLHTDSLTFYHEVAGEDLPAGQSDVGTFERHTLQWQAHLVEVDGYWFEEGV